MATSWNKRTKETDTWNKRTKATGLGGWGTNPWGKSPWGDPAVNNWNKRVKPQDS